jgi:ubiquilin
MRIKLTIKCRSDETEVESDTAELLNALQRRLRECTGIEIDEQVLTFNDRILTDSNKELGALGIGDGSVLYLKRRIKVAGEEKKPDFAASMMKNPLVKNFLKNPDAMKNILEMFPGLKEEMNENSELRMLMNSSNLRDELEMFSSNPEYMNTQLKNLDITMSKLENMPGGLNMINSMIKDVRDPLSSALMDGVKGGYSIKEGKKIDQPINEAIPGPKKREAESNLLKYRHELADLRQLGFRDAKRNLEALVACNGDLESSIIFLENMQKKSRRYA